MIHVALRILVWVLVLGMAYLVFGPQVFDSSDRASPFANRAELFLPPAKTQRELEYEALQRRRMLNPEELAEYEALVKNRRAAFWRGGDPANLTGHRRSLGLRLRVHSGIDNV